MEAKLKQGAILFILLSILLVLTGCSREYTSKDPVSGKGFEEAHIATLSDGCAVSALHIAGVYTIYRVKCPDGTGSTTHSCGKYCTANVTYEIQLTPQQETEIKKKAALAKLTPIEKQALGLIPEPPKEDNAKR